MLELLSLVSILHSQLYCHILLVFVYSVPTRSTQSQTTGRGISSRNIESTFTLYERRLDPTNKIYPASVQFPCT